MKTDNRREVLKDKNRLEIGRYYSLLDWLDASTADRMNRERKRILDALENQVDFGCNQTKLDVSDLSPVVSFVQPVSGHVYSSTENAMPIVFIAQQNKMKLVFPKAMAWNFQRLNRGSHMSKNLSLKGLV